VAAPSHDLTRRERNKHRHRQEILAAALAVFAEKGYADASVQEIADRADFAVSTIYALFENKEDLYKQVSREVGRRAGEIFEAAMERGAGEYEKLVNYARAKGEAFRENPAGSQMLMHEQLRQRIAGDSALPKDGIGRIYARFMERIRALFESGIEKGLFVAGDPALMAGALDSMTHELIRLSLADAKYYYDDHVDEVVKLFFGPVYVGKSNSKRKES
jgi:AcrR family transcriptional regulator